MLAAVYGSSRLNVAFKPAFERSRPDFWEHLSTENTFSFPSGHAMGSMSLAAPLVVLTWGSRYRWAALAVAVVYVLAVGASRVYLGVHFPSDVLAGWCLTVLWVGILVVILLLVTRVLRRYAPTLADWV
ncbi:phosphatase PAP2 family protein [Dietzia kunjamensis]|uniref:phosphatase PAP2 family protein n=1 Tax=Dietzia kunjamensis TaxID=322509 RepID=UPI002097EC9D|nr:phosphatase PAP2 family protein [Dietzia kunjamensis]USX45815.1 phosphatase PAP2 family protein [Dietzia kunjamensis]